MKTYVLTRDEFSVKVSSLPFHGPYDLLLDV